MAGTVKKLQFTEGTDVGAPTDLSLATSTTTISEYADDAAFVTANGSASAGDVYINSTAKVLRYYTGSAWRNAVPAMDPTDATKTFLIDISGNTANMSATLTFAATGNRVYTFPDVSITVASRAGAETLLNKTLTTPLITTNGSIDVTGAGTLAIGASMGANNLTLGGSSSTVLVAGNLQVNGTTTTVNSTTLDVADKNITVSKGGNDAASEGAGITVDRTGTKGSFIYKAASASKWAIGPAGAELDVVDVSSTQGISNKTFTVCDHDGGTASNTSRITLPKDTKSNLDALTRKAGTVVYATDLAKPYYDDGSILKEVGSGSGSGGINYITNGTFEDNNVTGWATYADAAAVSPVDGTAGSPSSTFASTASSPLRGTYSGLFTKGAANRQGEGFSYDFTIANADKSRPLLITWEGSASANYTGSSGSEYLSVFVYDVTNATLITPVSTTVAQGTSKGNTYFVATTSTSYRLIFHVAGTGTSSWTYTIDTVSVGPQSLGVSTPVSGWQSYSPTISGFGTTSSVQALYSRTGGTLNIIAVFTTGTVASSEAQFGFPTGLSVDPLITTTSTVGKWERGTATGGNNKQGNIIVSSGATYLNFALDDSATASSPGSPKNGDAIFGNTQVCYLFASVPISQWAGSANNSIQGDRAVEEFASNSSPTDANDTTSFVYGPGGSAGVLGTTALTTRRKKRVKFQSAIQSTDSIIIELQKSSSTPWVRLGELVDASYNLVDVLHADVATFYGMGIDSTSISGSEVDIVFAEYAASAGAASFGAASTGWNSGALSGSRWRVRKVSGGALVGYPISLGNLIVSNDTSNYSANTAMGLMVYTHSGSYNGGGAPTVSGSGISSQYTEFIPKQRSDGTWELAFFINGAVTSAQSITITVNGITSIAKAQPIYAAQLSDATTYPLISYVNASTADVFTKFSTSVTAVSFKGVISLASKPTWAY